MRMGYGIGVLALFGVFSVGSAGALAAQRVWFVERQSLHHRNSR